MQIGVEPLAADRFDGLADEVDINAVFPARAGVGRDRDRQRGVLAGGDRRNAGLLQINRIVAVPHVVAEPGGVGHELAQRDRRFRRPQFWFAVGVKAFQHLHRGEIGQQFSDRLVERQLALLDQLHRAGRRDGLGHGGNPEHAVGGHGIVFGEVAFAERALIDHLVASRGHSHDAGNFPGVALLPQQLVDLSLALHGVASSVRFLWSAAIFLPVCASRKNKRHPAGIVAIS